MGIILFDDQFRTNLLPLSFTRPVSEFRVGILTISDKWKRYLNSEISYLTEGYLQEKYHLIIDAENLLINSAICPDKDLLVAITKIREGEASATRKLIIN